MASSKSNEKNRSSFFGAIVMGAATGAFVGAAVVIAYGLTVATSVGASAGATLAARAALLAALGGVATSIGMRHKQRKTEKVLDVKEEQLQTQQEENVALKIEVALAKQREGERQA